MFNFRSFFLFHGLLNFSFSCRIKEKFPYAFDDICLYSEVSHLLAHCMFRLTSRRFIQELFQDVQFMAVRHYLSSPRSHTFSETLCLCYPMHYIPLSFFFPQMYEEAEAILTKLPKPVEEDGDPPAESWSSSPSCSSHSLPGPVPLQTWKNKKKRLKKYKVGEAPGMFLLLKTEPNSQGRRRRRRSSLASIGKRRMSVSVNKISPDTPNAV